MLMPWELSGADAPDRVADLAMWVWQLIADDQSNFSSCSSKPQPQQQQQSQCQPQLQHQQWFVHDP